MSIRCKILFSPLRQKLFWGYQSAQASQMTPVYGRGLIMGDSLSRVRMRLLSSSLGMIRKMENEGNALILLKWLTHGSQYGSWECTGKVKHFLWRACKDVLPTDYCLARRKVTKWDGCAWCGEKETSCHVLWDCKIAAETRKESGLKLPDWTNSY